VLFLISDQHRDVANFVTGIGVAMRVGDLIERISSADHGAQRAGVETVPARSTPRIGCFGRNPLSNRMRSGPLLSIRSPKHTLDARTAALMAGCGYAEQRGRFH
jgi:hypothetical protein